MGVIHVYKLGEEYNQWYVVVHYPLHHCSHVLQTVVSIPRNVET